MLTVAGSPPEHVYAFVFFDDLSILRGCLFLTPECTSTKQHKPPPLLTVTPTLIQLRQLRCELRL